MLVIFAGLPGSGKTSIARQLAHRIDATYLRVDTIEQAMAGSSLRIRPAEDAGYVVGYAVAGDNLRLGRTVIADSVNPLELTRKAWLEVAKRAGCESAEVEVVCSDRTEHRKRIETRASDLAGHGLPTWQDVLDRDYRPWSRDHIIIDTAGRSVEACVDQLLGLLPVFCK